MLLASLGMAQEPDQDQEHGPQRAQRNMREGLGLAAASSDPKPYAQVITKDAVSKKGIFTVHQVREKGRVKWYFEIPKDQLNKDFLWAPQFTAVPFKVRPNSDERGGQIRGGKVIRWEVRDNRVLIRAPEFVAIADKDDPLANGVAASNASPILMAFDVAAWGERGSAVIEVSKLYGTDVKGLGPGKGSVDASRSFIDRISAYPENIEAEATYTYGTAAPMRPASSSESSADPAPTPALRAAAAATGTYVVHYSMVKLPENPMMPRLRDDRVGFFRGSGQINFSKIDEMVDYRNYIARWRLEKKDPAATISEPVKPIVYYIDPATPRKYVPFLKRAVEAWQPVFEAAGFKNAIIAKEAPTPEQDPEWSTEDIRNTVIRWLPSTTKNAMGPHLSDPRSGEILNGNITVYHNVLDVARTWYFTQLAPLDPRAQKLPLSDQLMGELIEYIVKHEVGHTLGLMHNFKASSMYPQEKLRDPKWLREMGFCPSIMDYARFNYVAQPEDKIPVEDLWPKIGPYDRWAIHWGYAPVPNAKTPDDELPVLDAWAREQGTNPYLLFDDDMAVNGPDAGIATEVVGDADSVKSAALGIKNLHRVADMLLPALSDSQKGKPYVQFSLLYSSLWKQWMSEVRPVARLVGGMVTTNRHVGQEGALYAPVPPERQRAAVKFLLDNAFSTSSMSFLLKPEFLEKLGPGSLDRVWGNQNRLLTYLMDSRVWARMQEMALQDKNAYAPAEFVADMRKGVFKELEGSGPVKVDAYRMGLQFNLVHFLAKEAFEISDPLVQAVALGALNDLSVQVKAAVPRAADSNTRYHLSQIRRFVSEAIDRKFVPPGWGKRGLIVPGGRAITHDESKSEWELSTFDNEMNWPDEFSEGRQ